MAEASLIGRQGPCPLNNKGYLSQRTRCAGPLENLLLYGSGNPPSLTHSRRRFERKRFLCSTHRARPIPVMTPSKKPIEARVLTPVPEAPGIALSVDACYFGCHRVITETGLRDWLFPCLTTSPSSWYPLFGISVNLSCFTIPPK